MSDLDCPHCHATFDNLDIRLVVQGPDGTPVAIKHKKGCVDYPSDANRQDEEPTT
ncbi:hypothetical protein [Streptomyces sp. NPDC001422]|uniref:hypothetical protein n=1 Tax=Streptomyces sp. NPDC001422 TaxID=3364575 RepID=UPI0036931E26